MPLNIDIQQILLHILNFTVLFAATYFLLYNPIKKFMTNRNDYYDEVEKNADIKSAEADRIKTEYEEKLSSLNAEIDNIRIKSEKEAEEKALKILADANSEAAKIISESRQKAQKEFDNIIKSSYKEIEEIAKEEAQKLLFESTSDSYDRFIAEADCEEVG